MGAFVIAYVPQVEEVSLVTKVKGVDNVALLEKALQLDNVSNVERVQTVDNVDWVATVDNVNTVHDVRKLPQPVDGKYRFGRRLGTVLECMKGKTAKFDIVRIYEAGWPPAL